MKDKTVKFFKRLTASLTSEKAIGIYKTIATDVVIVTTVAVLSSGTRSGVNSFYNKFKK